MFFNKKNYEFKTWCMTNVIFLKYLNDNILNDIFKKILRRWYIRYLDRLWLTCQIYDPGHNNLIKNKSK